MPVLLLRGLVAAAGLLPWALALVADCPASVVAVFRVHCHQIPERTLMLGGAPMLVCSRCAGLYAGVALGALLPVPSSLGRWRRRFVAGAAGLLLLEVGLQALAVYPVSHPTRLGSGLAFGWAASAALFATLRREAAAP